jgi:hypothetical protein
VIGGYRYIDFTRPSDVGATALGDIVIRMLWR